jgi:hypothetical protein
MESEVIWEAPLIIKPEFRLYYDEKGCVLFYTCEKPEGNYVVIDSNTYAQGRPDVRVVDGKVTSLNVGSIVSKLVLDEQGIPCAEEDVSIVVDEHYRGNIIKWKLKTYEL